MNSGPGYEMRLPASEASTIHDVWPDKFLVYSGALKSGLRFLVHPLVEEVLDGFDLGLAQLTPNSWSSVLGYVAKCEMKGLKPSFNAFLRLVRPHKAKGAKELFELANRGEYHITFDKPSKHHFWRLRWVAIWTDDEVMELKFGRWQLMPRFLGGSEDFPALTR